MFSSNIFRPPPTPFPRKHDPGVRRWALKTPRPNLEKYIIIIHTSWLVSEILRILAAAFTSIFFELMVEPPRLKNYTQVKIYHQPPSSYTPPPRKFNISPWKRWVVRSTTSLFEHFGHSSRAFALKLRSKSCDASTQVLVVVFDVLMLEVPEVLKSFSPRISTGVIILPTQTMTLIREFIEIYHTVYLHWSLQKLGNLMTPVLWTICIGLENLCSFKPIRSEVAGGAIFVEKTRQWAYIELDLQGTPPKSHMNIKNWWFFKMYLRLQIWRHFGYPC